MKATLTVPQPPEVVPPVKFATGTELKHWTVVFAGQLIVSDWHAVGWVPEMAKVSVKFWSGTCFVPRSCVPGGVPGTDRSSSSEGDGGKVTWVKFPFRSDSILQVNEVVNNRGTPGCVGDGGNA